MASSYKIGYVIVIMSFLNPKGHQNPISGSKVTAILLKVKGWIWPIGGASAGEGLRSTGLHRLVLNDTVHGTNKRSGSKLCSYRLL